MHIKLKDGRLIRVYYHDNAIYKIHTTEKLLERSEWDENHKYFVTLFDLKSEEVEEAFNITYGVIYNAKIPMTPNEWILGNEDEVWTGEVYLHGGNYPGWEFIDRGESQKLVSLEDCAGQFLHKTTFYRKGRELSHATDEKAYLSMLDFKRGIVFYEFDDPVRVLADYEGEPFLFEKTACDGASIMEGLDAWKNG